MKTAMSLFKIIYFRAVCNFIAYRLVHFFSILVMHKCQSSIHFFSSPEPKALSELIVWDSSRGKSVRPLTLSNINISETSCPIKIKFHLEHHWGGELTALGFGQDRIRTLISMATDSSHRVVMGKILCQTTLAPSFLIGYPYICR